MNTLGPVRIVAVMALALLAGCSQFVGSNGVAPTAQQSLPISADEGDPEEAAIGAREHPRILAA